MIILREKRRGGRLFLHRKGHRFEASEWGVDLGAHLVVHLEGQAATLLRLDHREGAKALNGDLLACLELLQEDLRNGIHEQLGIGLRDLCISSQMEFELTEC